MAFVACSHCALCLISTWVDLNRQELHEDHYICLTAVKQDWRAMQFVVLSLSFCVQLLTWLVRSLLQGVAGLLSGISWLKHWSGEFEVALIVSFVKLVEQPVSRCQLKFLGDFPMFLPTTEMLRIYVQQTSTGH